MALASPRSGADDQPITPEDCYWYKQMLREVFGLQVFRYAKVNFVLGGCNCLECAPETTREAADS